MSDRIPSTNITRTRAGQDHYVSDIDETGLGTVDAVTDKGVPSSIWGKAWKHLRRRPTFWIAAFIVALAALPALFPSFSTATDPKFCGLSSSLAGPSAGHPFGSDKQGCDICARVVYGTRTSVSVGILTTLAVVLIGDTIGALAGYSDGWFGALLSRITDVFSAIPLLLAAIVFMQMFKGSHSIAIVVIILSMLGWASIVCITRGSILSAKNEEFVAAVRAAGVSRARILLSHIIPSSIAPIIVYATATLSTFIMSEASLSSIGINLPMSVVSWGANISSAQTSLRTNPMILFYPGAVPALAVLNFIMMDDVVHETLDPEARR